MIYLVTTQQELFDNDEYVIISAEESLEMMKNWKVIQLDSETGGRDAHLCDVKCVQFGNDAYDARIVVDASVIDIRIYKDILERTLCILQNGKFDLKFLFNYGIILRKIYDTMIVEQLLHLGWPSGQIGYSLADIAYRRFGIHIDKSIRGEIIWRGLDTAVIKYAAGDVTYLEKIMQSQIEDLRRQGLLTASHIECNAIASIAYFEWCGIHLDEVRWREKMAIDQRNLEESIKALNTFVTSNPQYRRFTYVDTQGDLFSGSKNKFVNSSK